MTPSPHLAWALAPGPPGTSPPSPAGTHFLSRSFCCRGKWTCTAYMSVLSGACFLPLTSCIIRLRFLFLSSLGRPRGHAPSPSLCLQRNFFTFLRTRGGIAPLLPGAWLLAGACTVCQASRARECIVPSGCTCQRLPALPLAGWLACWQCLDLPLQDGPPALPRGSCACGMWWPLRVRSLPSGVSSLALFCLSLTFPPATQPPCAIGGAI